MINSLLLAIDKYVDQHFTQIICYKAYASVQLPKVISCVEEARWHFPWCFASQQWMPLHSSWQSDWNLTSDIERKVWRHEVRLLLMNWNRMLAEKEKRDGGKWRKEAKRTRKFRENWGRNVSTNNNNKFSMQIKKNMGKEKMLSNNIDNSSLKKSVVIFGSLFFFLFSYV